MDTGLGVDTGIAIVADNVDAKGSSIFASSADVTLTASSGSDPIVLAQPIGNDTINDFDVTADKIDLVGFDSISGFDDAQSGRPPTATVKPSSRSVTRGSRCRA